MDLQDSGPAPPAACRCGFPAVAGTRPHPEVVFRRPDDGYRPHPPALSITWLQPGCGHQQVRETTGPDDSGARGKAAVVALESFGSTDRCGPAARCDRRVSRARDRRAHLDGRVRDPGIADHRGPVRARLPQCADCQTLAGARRSRAGWRHLVGPAVGIAQARHHGDRVSRRGIAGGRHAAEFADGLPVPAERRRPAPPAPIAGGTQLLPARIAQAFTEARRCLASLSTRVWARARRGPLVQGQRHRRDRRHIARLFGRLDRSHLRARYIGVDRRRRSICRRRCVGKLGQRRQHARGGRVGAIVERKLVGQRRRWRWRWRRWRSSGGGGGGGW